MLSVLTLHELVHSREIPYCRVQLSVSRQRTKGIKSLLGVKEEGDLPVLFIPKRSPCTIKYPGFNQNEVFSVKFVLGVKVLILLIFLFIRLRT